MENRNVFIAFKVYKEKRHYEQPNDWKQYVADTCESDNEVLYHEWLDAKTGKCSWVD